MTTFADIETGPAPDDVLALVKPVFSAPANYKAQDKIDAYKVEAETAWRERAALSALTGQVLAIGLLDADATRFLTGPEGAVLEAFWQLWGEGPRMVGFNVKGFDFPFLVTRSRILGVTVPEDLFEGRYWNRRIVDLQELWCCFSNRTEGQSLDAICKACGLGAKSGNGADFAKLFTADRKAALDYLGNDLELTAKLATRLGIV